MMPRFAPRRSLWLLVTAFVFLPGVTALWPALDRRPSCTRANEWAAHAQGFADYDEVVSLPMEYRRAVFAGLDTRTKTELWREQLRRLSRDSWLTLDQRAFIEFVADELTPDGLARRSLPSAEVIRSALRDRRDLWPAFTRLGPASGNLRHARTFLLNLQDAVRRGVTTTASSDCGCSNESDWCESFSVECSPGAPACKTFYCEVSMSSDACNYSGWGCGTMWSYPCNGVCSNFPFLQ